MRYSIILLAFATAAIAQSSGIAYPTGANSTHAIVPTGSAGNGSSGTNGTVNSASLKSTAKSSSTTSHTTSHSTSGTSSTSTSGSSTTSSGSTTSTSKAAAADMIQPVLGLGFAGVVFAAFL